MTEPFEYRVEYRVSGSPHWFLGAPIQSDASVAQAQVIRLASFSTVKAVRVVEVSRRVVLEKAKPDAPVSREFRPLSEPSQL